ncbi:unnamed protein product [Haemonchus placei]|uniref:Uncharacterized protein n=1 Tax=Haemonchus placei TaxID=6290 RepID=A0A3P7WIA2_HAEPC|nr:unnamed protein product [Haemonchus placei]
MYLHRLLGVKRKWVSPLMGFQLTAQLSNHQASMGNDPQDMIQENCYCSTRSYPRSQPHHVEGGTGLI